MTIGAYAGRCVVQVDLTRVIKTLLMSSPIKRRVFYTKGRVRKRRRGVIPAKTNPDFRFLPAFAGFPHFIDAAPLSRSDFLPPDPARHFPLEGKNRKVGTEGRFSRQNSKVIKSATVQSIKLREERFNKFQLISSQMDLY